MINKEHLKQRKHNPRPASNLSFQKQDVETLNNFIAATGAMGSWVATVKMIEVINDHIEQIDEVTVKDIKDLLEHFHKESVTALNEADVELSETTWNMKQVFGANGKYELKKKRNFVERLIYLFYGE